MTTLDNSQGTPLYVAGDDSASRAIIVLQEAFGVNHHIRDVAERFARDGFYAVSPVLFHRTGSPEVAYDDFANAMTHMGALNKDDLTTDIHAAVAFLHDKGYATANIGVVGYCMGGTVALYTDTLGVVGAAVSFYGGGVSAGRFGFPPLVELAPNLQAPWLGLYGDLDKGIPVEDVEALRAAAASSGQTTDIVRYPDAVHGFHCDARPDAFHPEAAADAAQRATEFLVAQLAAR